MPKLDELAQLDGFPPALAARMIEIDNKRRASGLVVIAMKDGEDVFRYACKDHASADEKKAVCQNHPSGRYSWRLASAPQ